MATRIQHPLQQLSIYYYLDNLSYKKGGQVPVIQCYLFKAGGGIFHRYLEHTLPGASQAVQKRQQSLTVAWQAKKRT